MATHDLHVTQWIRAPRAKVFAAWTTPEIMKQWFCPEDMTVVEASSDVRVGGHSRAVLAGPHGTSTVLTTYKEITPGVRLVLAHRWDEPDAIDTIVTVDFVDRDGGTEVTVTHAGLRDEASRRGHAGGWQSTLRNLAAHLVR